MPKGEIAAAARSGERVARSRWTRSLGGLGTHAPSLTLFLMGAGISVAVFFFSGTRARDRELAAFHADAAPIVANLRSAFELPLEVLSSSAALFEASREVTRAEFARFVKPALERHPGVRALEWIPVVAGGERARLEEAARADGLEGFEFRERSPGGAMVPASVRDEYLPIYFMEPGHPLVLGFDCSSEPERRSSADRARSSGKAVASERIQLIDDPPSTYSIAVFQPVFDFSKARTPSSVRGFTCEVFRVRAIAEQAIEAGLRRGIRVILLDLEAPPDKRVLFDSSPDTAGAQRGLELEAPLRYADRNWRIALQAGPHYQSQLGPAPWFLLISGLVGSALLSFAWSAARIIRRLRKEIHTEAQMGPYTLLEKLGEGGAGVVYKAKHAMLRRPTAIKLQVEPNSDPRRLARFEREVQLTSELSHPNTIAIYDYGRTADGTFYYAMEYIEGITLEQLVQRDGPLPAPRVVHILEQVCQALAEAHSVGLVHRDIKPSNLMLCKRGGIPDFIKVMDFGLVKNVGPSEANLGSHHITQSAATTVLGTPLYLAPEAIAQPTEVDARTDLYALGAVAYFLLVGEPVFDGETVVQVLSQHLHSIPVRPSERTTRELPAALESIIMRSLEKNPEHRQPSALALLEDLRALTGVAAWSTTEAQTWWNDRGDAIVRALQQEARVLDPKRADPVARATTLGIDAASNGGQRLPPPSARSAKREHR